LGSAKVTNNTIASNIDWLCAQLGINPVNIHPVVIHDS